MIKLFVFLLSLISISNSITLSDKEKQFIQKHPVIILGADKNWLPYISINSKGQIEGFDKEILDHINKITGANFQIYADDWYKVLNKAKLKKIDGLSTSAIHKERREYFNFSIPYVSHDINLLVKHGNPLRIKSLKDLQGKTVVLQKGNLFNKKLVQDFANSTIIYKNSTKETLEEVIYGNADATIGIGSNNFLNNEKGLPYLNKAFKLSKKLNLVFSIREDWPEAITILNKAIKSIPDEKKLSLENKWFHTVKPQNSLFSLTKKEKEYIHNKKAVNICTDLIRSSFTNKDKNKKILTTILLEKILLKLKLEENLIYTNNWAQSLQFIKEKKCDLIASIQNTPKRAKYINFTKPYTSFPLMLITHQNTNYVYNLESIKNKTVAVIKDNAAIGLLKKRYKDLSIVYVNNGIEGLKKVKNKEVFAYVGLLPAFISIFKEVDNIKINRELDIHLSLSIGVRNDDEILFEIISKTLASIDKIETRKNFDKIIELLYKKNFDYTPFVKLFLISILIILLVLYWNLRLKREINKAVQKNRKQESLIYYYSKQDAMRNLVCNITHQWKQPINELSSVLLFIETKLHLKQNITQKEIEETSKKAREITEYLSETVTVFSNFYIDNKQKNDIYILTLINHSLFISEGSFEQNNINTIIDIKNKNLEIKGKDLEQVIISIFNNITNIVVERKIQEPLITIRLYRQEHYIILEIEDNCGGIENISTNIFELGESSTKNGTGLGLYIAKRIIEDKYNGNISVKNTPNGALFKIIIPEL